MHVIPDGLAQGTAQIEAGRAEHVLVIGADFVTRITDYQDRNTRRCSPTPPARWCSAAGGDGRGEIGPIVLGADGSHARTIFVTHYRAAGPDGRA